jgi:hypothetical protein
MDAAVMSTRQWSISAHPRGEVLTARAAGSNCELVVLGVPSGFTAPEVEGWLSDLIGVARETARGDEKPHPIPVLLHHSLTGLLFSHSEVWKRGASGTPCSFAAVHAEREIGFGWVGEARVEVSIDGRPIEIEWVVVRDEAGSEARAFGVDATRRVRVVLEWGGSATEPAVTVEAEWPAEEAVGRPAPAPAALAAPAPAAPAPAPAAPAATVPAEGMQDPLAAFFAGARPGPGAASPGPRGTSPSDQADWKVVYEEAALPGMPVEDLLYHPSDGQSARRGGGFRAWLDRLLPWRWSRRASRPEATIPAETLAEPGTQEVGFAAPAEPLSDELIPPTPEPAELTARAAGWQGSPAGADAPDPFAAAGGGRPAAHREGELHPRLAGEATGAPTGAASAPPGPGTESPRPVAWSELRLEPASPEPVDRGAAPQGPPPAAPSLDPPAPAFLEPVVAGRGAAPAAAPAIDHASRAPLRPAWPTMDELERESPPWKRAWVWIALAVVALFAVGWLVGGVHDGRPGAHRTGAFTRALRALGIGSPRFEVVITSRPAGAWIAADGRDLVRRTPASVELSPGAHRITLSFADLGSAGYTVNGQRGDQLVLDAPLWGSLVVHSADDAIPVSVAVDGVSAGFAPVRLDSLMPGPHELRFSGPGMAPWGEAVRIRVGEATEVIARPMTSPATGVIEVRATLADEEGAQALAGASVWVDGERRGVTPLTLEMARGPHSIRVEYRGEEAPVQLIDLPGGNQRFATFELGLNLERPSLRALSPPARIPLEETAVISAGLQGVAANEVREMWLHVAPADGPWRRYQMVMMKAPVGVVGVAVFPPSMFDERGIAHYYVSASIQTGDEYFTEILSAQVAPPSGAAKR